MNGNPVESSDRSAPARDPFAGARSPAGKLMLALGMAAALYVAWRFTRVEGPTAPASIAAVAPDSGGNAVMLTANDAKRIGVTYAAVVRGPLASELRIVGSVAYDETRLKTIAPKVDGYVEELFVAFTGQPVEVGQPLLRIYSPMLVTAQEELLLALRFVADVGVGSADAARNAADLVTGARRRLKQWDITDEDIASVERTRLPQRTLTVRSPLSGVVVQKNVQAGQRIMAGDALYQVADLHELWLEGEIFEGDRPSVRVGQSVSAEFAGNGGAARTGRIVFIAPSLSTETRTTRIRIALANHDGSLQPGMFATIRIHGDLRANALSVPRSAVLVTGERTLVFVRTDDGMLVPRDVVVGVSTADRVEIARGLRVGETVVASATFLVDAESNLGSALSAMAGMPGMDHGPVPAETAKAASPARDPMAGMNHGPTKKP